MYKILVEIPNGKLLSFTVDTYSKENGKVLFIDSKTNLPKDFPDRWCGIEKVLRRGFNDRDERNYED